ncbi:hypothetical protein BH11ACT6_BH11ACT6_44680 [soil metagenome]
MDRDVTYLAAPLRFHDSSTKVFRHRNAALALMVVTAIALVVVPDLITYLSVEHQPIVPPGEAAAAPDLPLAQLASLAGSAALLALSALIVLAPGRPNRPVAGLFALLLALNLPYLVSPELPGPSDLIKVVLANVFIVALWNIGAPIAALKWLPITVAVISVYSLIGGLIIPENMMYNIASEKAIIAGWELAGPFGHANVLGMYCAVAFAFLPLITGLRWRLVTGSILLVTLLAAASRTALIAAAVVVLWWLLCRFRSLISIRTAGTVLACSSAAAMFVVPFVSWDRDAFTDRASVWVESIHVWQQSPLVGMGVNWFLEDAQQVGNIAKWAFVGTGHNFVIDTLVKSGLVGIGVLLPLLAAAIWAARVMPVTDQQIACFGFLIAFFVAATTEAVWALMPNLQLFPISGLVFAVLILARHDSRTDSSTVEGTP